MATLIGECAKVTSCFQKTFHSIVSFPVFIVCNYIYFLIMSKEISGHYALIRKPMMPLSVKHVYVNWYVFSKTHSRTISRRPACEIVELCWGEISKEILI